MELRYCEKCGDIIKLEGKDERINPAEHFVCPRCEGGAEGAPAGKDSFEGILDQSTLNLFSPSTLAIKRSELIKEAPHLGDAVPNPSKPPTVRAGSSFPARTARKLQFRCLHCRSTLMIRPVEKPSRMVCPKCQGSLFIDQTGIVSKRSPGGSVEPAVSTAAGQAAPVRIAAGAPPQKAEGAAASPPRPVAPPAAPAPRPLAQAPAPRPAAPAPAPKAAHPQAHPAASAQAPSRAATASARPSPEAKPGSVRRMPSSIQRTFATGGQPPAASEPRKAAPGRVQEDPLAGAVLESTPGAEARTRPAKSSARVRQESSPATAPVRQEDLFRGLSISGRQARGGSAVARKAVHPAPGSGPRRDFEELEAELSQVEDFTKPLPEASSPLEKVPHSTRRSYAPSAEPVGFLRRVAVLVLVPALALAVSAPYYFAGHLSMAGGAPSDSPLAAGSQRPVFERLGKVVERGKAAILALPVREDHRVPRPAPAATEEAPAAGER
jgi:hypothetical protein